MLDLWIFDIYLSSEWLIFFGIGITVLILYRYWTVLETRKLSCYKLPPGRSGLPFVGETFDFLRRKGEFLKEKRRLYGPIYRTHLFGKPTIRVTGYENIRYILEAENTLVQSCWPSSVKKIVGENGVLLSTGEEHRQKRKILTTRLSHEYLSDSTSNLSANMSAVIEHWKSLDNVDIFPACADLALELIARHHINENIDPSDLQRFKICAKTIQRCLFAFPVNIPGLAYNKALHSRRELGEILRKYLFDDRPKNSAIRGMLKSADSRHPPVQCFGVDLAFEMVFAGTDATAGAMFALIHLLQDRPDILAGIRKELGGIGLMEKDANISYNDIQRLTYTKRVVKEVLRLLPPVGGVYREVLQSFKLDGFDIPKGWTIILGIRETQENDTRLPDREEIKPERWEGEDGDYLFSFGGGARNCPAKYFAQLIIYLFLIEISRSTDWCVLDKKVPLDNFPTPRPRTIMRVAFTDSQAKTS